MARKTIFEMEILAEKLKLQKYYKTLLKSLDLEGHEGGGVQANLFYMSHYIYI